ncbi:hypothetical protein ACFE04_007030 [Oxalis oulophora]
MKQLLLLRRPIDDQVEESSSSSSSSSSIDNVYDGKVYVAVGKSIEKGLMLLKWTCTNFKQEEICLLHVHQPSPLIPTPLGKLPVARVNDLVVAAYRREEKLLTTKLMETYLTFFSASKVKASMVTIDADQVQKGILQLINKCCIRKLIMGDVPEKAWSLGRELRFYTAILLLISGPLHEGKKELKQSKLHCAKLPLVLKISQCKSMKLDTNNSSFHESTVGVITCARVSNWVLDEELPNITQRESDSKFESENIQWQVTDANIEAEASENEAFSKMLQCREMELEATEVIKKVKLLETSLEYETKLKEEAEEVMRSTVHQKEKLIKQRKDESRKLHKATRSVADLNIAAHELIQRRDEATDKLKLIQSSIATLRQEKQMISRQIVEANRWLDRWKNGGQPGAANCNGFIWFVEKLTELAEFTVADLETATCNFSQSFKLGQGGYGCVYKGEMLGRTVAIKKLYLDNMQRQLEFQQEVHVLGRLQHPHLVTLLGACPDAWSLVYEYLPNGSLKDHLFRKNNFSPLPWQIRVRMILEISSAVCFLHSSKPEKVIHGNLKPENILLDAELHCKICDFGICRLITENTLGRPYFCQSTGPYTDPEFNRIGVMTPKSDIYSFGVIILQLVTGRPPNGLVGWVRRAVLSGKLLSILDSLAGEWPMSVARRLVEIGLQCCEMNGRDRPDLTPSLVQELEHLHVLEERPLPPYFLCPILQESNMIEIMHDPQVAADGFTYEGEALRGWLANGRKTSPMTNLKLDHLHLTPNHALRLTIQDWLCKQ